MTTTFIIICVVMTLIAILAVVLPLWFGARVNPDADRRSQVLAILRQQAADGRLARAGRRFKYTSGPATQCFKQIREQGLNGQDFCGMIEHAPL